MRTGRNAARDAPPPCAGVPCLRDSMELVQWMINGWTAGRGHGRCDESRACTWTEGSRAVSNERHVSKARLALDGTVARLRRRRTGTAVAAVGDGGSGVWQLVRARDEMSQSNVRGAPAARRRPAHAVGVRAAAHRTLPSCRDGGSAQTPAGTGCPSPRSAQPTAAACSGDPSGPPMRAAGYVPPASRFRPPERFRTRLRVRVPLEPLPRLLFLEARK